MNKFIEEFESKKFLIVLLLMCVLFLVLVIGAFQYIPEPLDNNAKGNSGIENLNQPSSVSSVSEEQTESEDVQQSEEKASKKELNIKLPKYGDEKEVLENIEDLPAEAQAENNKSASYTEEKTEELTPKKQAERIFSTAQTYKENKQYVKAIEEFQKALSTTDDVNMKAKCLEEIATVYAIVKRYGTALSFAQKAYNTSPSSSREMLLARLYYKTGDINKATQRINNVLHRDFSADR